MNERIIRVWDVPTRLFHWLLAALVVAAVVSAKIGGNAMIWHGRFGHLILGLIVFRLAWGVVGSTYARFGQFVRGPRAVMDYLRGRWCGVGHNPLGALSVLALLGVVGFQATTGLFANDDIAFKGPLYAAVSSATSNQITGWHRQAEWWIYGLVALHVAAVLFHVVVKREQMIGPMVTGRKRVDRQDAEPARGGGAVALLVALALSATALWAAGGGLLPEAPPAVPPPPTLDW